jgi:hypothetical protein|tara:strand:- start:104 stop:262 length:159 start_codon:yes stop_codon:yes gene_type:complete
MSPRDGQKQVSADAVDGGGTNRYTNAVAIRPNVSPTIADGIFNFFIGVLLYH